MTNDNKELKSIYIPEDHKKYDLLPICRECNTEMIVWSDKLLRRIKELTNMNDYDTCPYRRYNSYADFLDEMDNWIEKYPNCKQEIIEYRDSVLKINNKDLWAVVKYIGESNYLEFTKNKYYYVVMYIENNSWKIRGIIDDEEYDAFLVWSPNCTHPVDLLKDLEIIIDPSNNLQNEFAKIMNNL